MVAPAIVAAGISAAGSLLGGLFGQSQADKQADLQKEFAKNSIRWRVKDATAAGVHPLYALGAPTVSYAPQAVGADLASGISNAGQDIGRAVAAGMTPESKSASILEALTLDRAALENDLLRSQIRATNAAGTAAGLPSVLGDPADPLKIAGVSISRNPGWSDAQDIENRYGELGDYLYGVPVMATDAKATVSDAAKAGVIDRYMSKSWSDWFYGQ